MEHLRIEEEILIQNRIDNALSPSEEALFNKLIETSETARKYYRELMGIDKLIKHDVKKIPIVDFSKEIIKQILKNNRSNRNNSNKGRMIRPKFSVKILPYAAVLIFGLLVGSVVSYVMQTNETPDKQMLVGTMTNKPMHYSLALNNTEIHFEEFRTNYFKLTTVAVESTKPVDITLLLEEPKLETENIKILFSDGLFQLNNVQNKQFTYSCMGTNVIQINRKKIGGVFPPFTLQLKKDGSVFKEMKFD